MRGVALVKYVASGSQVVLLIGNCDDARAKNHEAAYQICGIRAPRMAIKTNTVEEPDEPFAFECREFLRTKVVGKVVKFNVVGAHNGRNYVTLTHEDKDIAALMVSEGYARVAPEAFLPQPENMPDLVLLEKHAKEERLGLWSATPSEPRPIRWAQGDAPFVKAFAEKHVGQELLGIVEYVRDADYLRIYFTDEKVFAQCQMTGISCPQMRKAQSQEPEQFAVEAKEFVELRLWGRSLKFRIDGCDQFGTLFVSPLHPRGSIIELLLSEGFARINETSARFYPEQSKLRQLLKEAQGRKLRRWNKLEAATPAKIPDSRPSDTPASPGSAAVRSFNARVIEIYNGDSISVVPLSKLTSATNPPPCEIILHEQRLYLASIRCPRPRTRTRDAEPFAVEAMECAKAFCAGKKVKVVVDYIRTPTPSTTGAEPPPASDDEGRLYYCTIYVGQQSLNMELVKKGLARTQRHRVEEDRAEQYDDLLLAEKEAQDAKVGMYTNKELPKHRINDLCGPANTQKARAMEQSLRREGNITVYVEAIINGGRYRCVAPQLSTQFTFILSGVRAPQLPRVNPNGVSTPGQPFAEDSVAWARFHLLHRKFIAQIQACDRGGAFIGLLWRPESLGKESVNAKLVQAGLAQADNLRMCTIAAEIQAAERQAVEKRVGIWALPESVEEWQARQDPSPGGVNSESVGSTEATSVWSGQSPGASREVLRGLGVSYVESAVELYCQFIDDDERLTEVQNLVNKLGDEREDMFQERFTSQRPPRKGDVILCRFTADNAWYRGRIQACEGTNYVVFYIDYGNREKVSIDRLLKCPPEVNVITYPPFAKCFSLAGIKVLQEQERAARQFLGEITADPNLQVDAVIVGARDSVSGSLPAILSMHGTESTINEELLAAGLARVNSASLHSQSIAKDTIEKWNATEKSAKSKRLGMWFYGDVGNSEDEDDDMPVLRR